MMYSIVYLSYIVYVKTLCLYTTALFVFLGLSLSIKKSCNLKKPTSAKQKGIKFSITFWSVFYSNIYG